MQGYATSNRLAITNEYVDIETAKESGRSKFEEMLRFLKSHPTVRIILVEKTDRLYRNLKDWVRLDDYDVEIHLVKEGTVLSRNSRSSEKFMHGIKVLMAKNYIDVLSEEIRKGMLEKAEQGIWPSRAPLGYLNVIGADGKRTITVDPKFGPIIAQLFGWYATGTYSLKDLGKKADEAGLAYRKSGRPISISNLHDLLRNRMYTGDFEWNGRFYSGKHEPLVTRDLWERVQGVLQHRNASKTHTGRDFPFSGAIVCGHCGCAMVGELKKKKYVYYHCTGYKGKCPEPYVRQEVIEEQLTGIEDFELHAGHARIRHAGLEPEPCRPAPRPW